MPSVRVAALVVLMLVLVTASGCGQSALHGESWTKQFTSEPGECR